MIAGRYELGEVIGRGGMATVWHGHDIVLGRDVALKKIRATDAVSIERAQREARLAARLNDSHVVSVYDLVTEDGQSWLVMEHVDGTSLAERIADLGALDRGEVSDIGADVAEALVAAHAAEIVHRDVKPSNVLLPIDGSAQLSDFGIARGDGDDAFTRTGLVTGSPAYLAPEVAAGQRATAASDVWSLGATLLHAATGQPPFEGADHVMGTLYRIVNDPPPRLDGHDALALVIADALQHDPDARPTAAQVARRLSGDSTGTRTMAAFTPTPMAASTAGGIPRRTAVAAASAVAVLAAVALALTTGDDPDTAAAAPPSATPTTAAPVVETTPAPTVDPEAAAMADFAEEFVEVASDEPRDGFELLSPEYQRASGGLRGFREFWDRVEDPDITSMSVDSAAMTVTYTYRYFFDEDRKGPGRRHGEDDEDDSDGDERIETVRLQLRDDVDGYRITDSDSL